MWHGAAGSLTPGGRSGVSIFSLCWFVLAKFWVVRCYAKHQIERYECVKSTLAQPNTVKNSTPRRQNSNNIIRS